MTASEPWPRPSRSEPSGTSPENRVARLWHETDKLTTAEKHPSGAATRLTCDKRLRPEQDSNLRPTA